ncbi:MAG TPA: hypothetical protein VGK56_18760 [Anaerolineales bacterium]
MINWIDYHEPVRKGIAEMGRANPDILRGYRVAVQVKAGSALIYSTRVLDALKAKTEQSPGGNIDSG